MTKHSATAPENSTGEQQKSFINFGFLSTFVLKLIAIVSMTIDHIGVGLGTDFNQEKGTMFLSGLVSHDTYELLRCIGRLAFPIFCYLIAQGLLYTRDVKRYAGRLFLFAIISQVPFSLMSHKTPFMLLGDLNVYFTLFIGLIVIAAIRHLLSRQTESNRIQLSACCMLIALVGAWLADLIGTDYGSFGVILILVFYLLNHSPLLCCVVVFCLVFLTYGGLERYSVFALIPIMLHNHKKGPSMKYFFYAYYPAHMLIIYILYATML